MLSYCLVDEEWIPVELADGGLKKVSMKSIFANPDRFRAISGNPLEAAVLHRFLLAVLYTVDAPASLNAWGKLWQNPAELFARTHEYLLANKHKFDVFDPERPFLQHPGLAPGDKPLAVIQHERAAGNNPVFLDASQEHQPEALDPGQAVLSLLVNFAFGGSHPDKSSPMADPNQATMFAGPLCARAVGVVEGRNLGQTLLYNLVPNDRPGKASWEVGVPAKPGQSHCEGPADLFTRLTRFARFKSDQDTGRVWGLALHMGVRIDDVSLENVEPMMARYLAKDKKFKPQRLDTDRAVWRSLHVLMAARESTEVKPIAAVAHLSRAVELGILEEEAQVALRILGMAGEAQGPVTELWRDERMPFRLRTLRNNAIYESVSQNIKISGDTADALRHSLWALCRAYVEAQIPNPNKEDIDRLQRSIAGELGGYWGRLAEQGERLALDLPSQEEWRKTTEAAARAAFRDAVNALPSNASRYRAEALVPGVRFLTTANKEKKPA